MEEKGIKAVFSAAVAGIAAYSGAVIFPLICLIVMMIIDYATGMTAAWIDNNLSSRIGAKGIAKKVGYMALVAVAVGVDYLVNSGFAALGVQSGCYMYFGLLVIIWLSLNEMISILENLSRIGVPIPGFLRKIIRKLKVTVDKEGENDNEH